MRGSLYEHQQEAVNVQAGILRWETGANCKFRNWKSENIGFLFFIWQPFNRMSFELSKSKKNLSQQGPLPFQAVAHFLAN